ncbi:MAG: RluA family pseudouridine synthase [Oscillospiraceae bacterium]|nr:RluA family pseudouridine synthase [Oscillospiraceae bacterium]
MDNVQIIIADSDHKRLDKFISECGQDISRSLAQRLIDEGNVTVNGRTVRKSAGVSAGDSVEITVPPPEVLTAEPQNIPLEIIYEDNDLIVVNKPKGMVVHPAVGNPDRTLVNALMYHCRGQLSTINGVIRPGIVHRIDKNTSGLLVVAKNDAAHNGLAAQIKAHSMTREYLSVVSGHFHDKNGTVDAPIGRSPDDRMKMTVIERNSKPAVTHFEVIEDLRGYSFIRCRLETGRTHQIRVHMAYIGHPVLGDDVYGKPFKGIEGQCLHAYKIGFIHPISGEYMEWSTVLPQYFSDVLKTLGSGLVK